MFICGAQKHFEGLTCRSPLSLIFPLHKFCLFRVCQVELKIPSDLPRRLLEYRLGYNMPLLDFSLSFGIDSHSGIHTCSSSHCHTSHPVQASFSKPSVFSELFYYCYLWAMLCLGCRCSTVKPPRVHPYS